MTARLPLARFRLHPGYARCLFGSSRRSLLQSRGAYNREDHLQPTNVLRALGAVVVIAAAATPALAGVPAPVPGPLIGAGAPALALLGGAYYLIRKRRRR
jgi:hypothetical protein